MTNGNGSKRELGNLFSRISGSRDELVYFLCEYVKIPAIDPRSGGEGEAAKVAWLEKKLRAFGFTDIQHYDAPDDAAPTKVRPNLLVQLPGKNREKRIWLVVHTDIVPPGDRKKWDTDPFVPIIKDGRIYGRGTEDNGQEAVASLYALKTLKDLGITPTYDVGIAFVADEETGSKFGIKYLMDKGIFQKGRDFFVVPDGGNEAGTLIEVAEKSIMWLKIETEGRQAHASMPDHGINSFKVAMKYASELDQMLYAKYNASNPLFNPPISTFEPTKKDANVPNVNTIPGDDVFYLDSRILPEYHPEEVLAAIRYTAVKYENAHGVKIKVEPVNFEPAAPPTPADSWIVGRLHNSIHTVYSNEPFVGGIGGGTCAAIFRRAGFDAVVWSKINDMAHAPNEYAVVDNMINDAKVYAALLTAGP